MIIYVLFEEESDQYGTSRMVGLFASEDLARASYSKTKRSFIQEFALIESNRDNRSSLAHERDIPPIIRI